MNILIVEDNDEVREILKDVFQSVGVSIVEATNGLEALETLKNSVFDLILTDVQMPKLDGYNLIKEVKSLKIDTPVIVISGGSKYSREDILNAGASEYFEKCSFNPFNISVFSQKSA